MARDARSIQAPQSSASAGRTRVAVRLFDWSEWCRQVVRGVQAFAHEQPHWRVFVDVGAGTTSRARRSSVRDWDGVITAFFDDLASWRRLLHSSRTPVVAITAAVPASLRNMPRVRVDDDRVAQLAVRHLLAGGFRRLAYYGSRRSKKLAFVDQRLEAMQAVARSNACPLEIHYKDDSTPSPARKLRRLAQWVTRLEKPVGILAWNMTLACELVEACRRAGVAVPDQAAVIGWDDDALLAETSDPTVSGVVLPAQRLGHEAARLLDRLLCGQRAPDSPVIIEPSGVIHIRQSSDVSTLPDREVQLALQYIREHAAEPFRIGTLVDSLGVSRRKLEQDFRRVVGHSPNQALMRARLERAKQLLVETSWPINLVSQRAGFGTIRRLHQLFLEREKATPMQYRARFGAV